MNSDHIFDYNGFFQEQIDGIKAEGRYRSFMNMERIAGRFPQAVFSDDAGVQKEVTIWCSNDYLGMGQHPKVVKAAQDAIERSGTGAGGTRNISGWTKCMALVYMARAEQGLRSSLA